MTKHTRLMALTSLMLGPVFGCYAATVSLDEAKAIATEFVSARNAQTTASNLTPVYTAESDGKPVYYVFNVGNNAGFVMVSAETCATPVLGYSFQNGFPVGSTPEAMKWMINGLEREIKAAPSIQASRSTSEMRAMARSAARQANAEKLLSTPKWSQEAPFNNLIPGKPLVGCVGTAMATVMKYYNWPAQGSGSFDGVDFNVAYDWDNMRADNYRSDYSAEEGEAVATLMYHASKAVDTQYAMSGSSAYEVRVPGALSTYFGYDPGASYKKRSDVATQAEWDEIVKNEIDENRPVIYCGQDVTAGHAFVCDGYQGEYLHFNWGWGGSADGYFLSTALNPTVSRTHHYNNLNTIIYNIKPASGAISAWSPIHITADGNQVGIGSDLTDLASGQTFTVRVGNLKNLSLSDFNGKIAVALFDENGNMKSLLSNEANFTMQSMGYLFNSYMDFNGCKLPAGIEVNPTDKIRIATRGLDDTAWLPIAGELPTLNELAVSLEAPASFNISLPSAIEGVSIEGANSVIRGWNYSFKVTPLNPAEDVITVKANGVMILPNADNLYSIANVCRDQQISILVQKAADVVAKRSVWVETPGTLASIISESEAGAIRELTLFGSIDARDFAYMKNAMNLNKLDLSGVYIAAHGSDQANALPREAFRGKRSLTEVILPNNLNRINNGAFFQTGITSIVIPAGVSKYEYNVFVGCTSLRDIYVKRAQAEFINWCVLSGCKVDLMTLHVPSEAAWTNYNKAENWNTIKNIIVDQAPETNDVLFAVMENADVKFNTEATLGTVEKGTAVSFTAENIADNDNRMDVYANNTLLRPDAEGNYSTVVNANTIIRFDMVAPISTENNGKSQWSLNDKNGSIGLFTDAVNVLPGQAFTIRANALNVPAGMEQLFWAAALTDSKGNIKEFISPVLLWNGGSANNHKMNINCCVNESKVREGNQIRLVTSANNKKTWQVVKGENDQIVDAIPAVNNMNEVYNINITQNGSATVSGVPETAVRGRDITMKVTPSSAAYRVDVTVNGEKVAQNAAVANYSFVAMQDMDIDIDVYDPKADGVCVINTYPGGLHVQLTEDNVAATVVVKGEVYSLDLQAATGKDFAINTIKTLDLSGVKIIETGGFEENVVNHPFFVYTNGMETPTSVCENIILPDNVVKISGGIFKNVPNMKEITLPKDLRSVPTQRTTANGGKVYDYGLGDNAFGGCPALTTIYIPGTPDTWNGNYTVAHHNPYNPNWYNLGHPDAKKVTIVVPQEYLSVYRTANNSTSHGNPWKAHGYNILAEYPVYGVNFDPTRIQVVDEDVDINTMASFLGNDVTVESKTVASNLKLVDNERRCMVFDNGTLITPNEDGTIGDITFYNPAKKADLAGFHQIDVVYSHELAFNKTSELFQISEVVAENDKNIAAELDSENNILKNIAENSTVTFKVDFEDNNEGLEARVMMGTAELTPDANGLYTVEITNADKNIDIYAVPSNGVTLTADELAAIDPAESAAITEIGLAGDLTEEDLAQALECFPNLENLDLSGLTSELPEGAFEGLETLTTVVLPQTTEIPASAFNGCSNLQSVDIPSSVTSIGSNAFANCSSLESLSMTGINEIGNSAFNGCENLTTITILADVEHALDETPAQTRRRSPKRISVKGNSFDGMNTNCFVILDEGVEVPATNVNIIRATVGEVTEMIDGVEVTRQGRTYSANSDITLSNEYALRIPHTFTLDNASISLESENKDWNALLVPFNVQKVMNVDKDEEVEIALYVPEARSAAGSSYYLYTLPEDGESLESVTEINANVPYMFYAPESSNMKFSAQNIQVPATPSQISVEGKNFTLHATYAPAEAPATNLYLLDNDCAAFRPVNVEEDGETIQLNSFEIYATSPVDVDLIATNLPGTDVSTEVEGIALADTGLKIAKEGNLLIIVTDEEMTAPIYTLDGRVAAVVNLLPGRNVVELPGSGLYILAGRKFRF